MPELVHLHSHSSFSVFDGTGAPESLAKRAAELGLPAQAITDHGRVSGIVEFHKACKKHGITPIHGTEAYIQDEGIKKAAHLIILAGNQEGLHNLYALSTKAEENIYRNRPCITRSMLEDHQEGLVIGSACIGSEVGQYILRDNMGEAERRAQWYRDLFKERYYLEIQNQNDGQPNQDHLKFMKGIIAIGDAIEAPVVATNDSHYTCSEEKPAHRLVLQLHHQGSPDLLDAYRADMSILDRRAMLRKLRVGTKKDMKPYVNNTMGVWKLLQDMGVESINPCRTQISMPVYKLQHGTAKAKAMGPIERIRAVCLDSLKTLATHGYIDKVSSDKRGETMSDEQVQVYKDRIEHELHIIKVTGFGDYFLIVADYVQYVKEKLGTLVGSGRGSAAGSMVAYLLRITEVDPIKYGLMFERMLNIDRPANKPPDIDLDFTPEVRNKVIDYLEARYGSDNVVRIGSFGNQKMRDAIRRVGSYLNMTRGEISSISTKVPDEIASVEDLMQKDDDGKYVFNQLAESFERDTDLWRNVAMLARLNIKHEARHAAGVVISDESISRWCPMRIPRGKDSEPVPISQFDMYSLEEVGLIKFDLLILGTMQVLTECVDAVKKGLSDAAEEQAFDQLVAEGTSPKRARITAVRSGVSAAKEFSLRGLDMEDPKVYDLFNKANTRGIFQLSSNPSIRELFARLKPTCLEDLAVGCALYRPGPLDSKAYWDGVEDPEERKRLKMSMTTRSAVEEYLRRRDGRAKVHSLHPKVDVILADTYGILIYQEQILKLAVGCAGYSTVEADKLREAVGKKKVDMLREQKPKFIDGTSSILGDKALAISLWDFIETFGNYGFNKSHSVSYAMLSYQTAYFKTYHPAIFYAALINQEIRASHQDRMVEYIYDAPKNGIEVLPPDILAAERLCKVVNDGSAVRLGLEGVKGISENGGAHLQAIVSNPDNHDLSAFLSAVNPKSMRSSVISQMTETGLLDQMLGLDNQATIPERLHVRGRIVVALSHLKLWRDKCAKNATYPSAEGFYADVESILQEKVIYYELRDLSKPGNLKGFEKWSQELQRFRTFILGIDQVLNTENLILGVFMSGNPMESYKEMVERDKSLIHLSELQPEDDGTRMNFAGVITFVTTRPTKRNVPFSRVRIADGTESVEAIVFYNDDIKESAIKVGNVVKMQARVEWKEGHTYVLRPFVVTVIGNLTAKVDMAYRVGIDCKRMSIVDILDLRSQLTNLPPGDSPIYLECEGTTGLLKSVNMTGDLFSLLAEKKHVSVEEIVHDFPEELVA